MTITPVFLRELGALTRAGNPHRHRVVFVVSMVLAIAYFFGLYAVRDRGLITHNLMARVASASFVTIVGLHLLWSFLLVGRAAQSVALEKERRTLDFLLSTRLGNAEIVLGKLLGILISFALTMATGLPILMLLSFAGGIDPRLVVLTYLASASQAFLMTSLGLWASIVSTSVRRAASLAVTIAICWGFLPIFVAFLLPRTGVTIYRPLREVNAWLLASGPFGLILKVAAGGIPIGAAASSLTDGILWMCGAQVAMGLALLVLSIGMLRVAYRAQTGGDHLRLGRAFRSPAWRWRKRPDVGDDPIFWRERYTSRLRGVTRLLDSIIQLGIAGTIAWGTYIYAKPAIVEVWRNGYTSGPTSDQRPEGNILLRFFLPPNTGGPADQARVEFSFFLRWLSVFVLFFLSSIAAQMGFDGIFQERSKETWESLLGTPLTGREILRSKFYAAIWRIRPTLFLLMCWWTLGLIAGSVHPVGFAVAIAILASWVWFLIVSGISAGMRTKTTTAGSNSTLAIRMLLAWSGLLPFMLPTRFSSVLLGVGSLPYDVALSLISYRDVRAAMHFRPCPPLVWMGISTGEGLPMVIILWTCGFVVPTVIGYFIWREAVTSFDRRMGRPYRPSKDA